MRQFTFPGNDKYWLANGSLYYKATTKDGEQTVFMAHPSGAEGDAIVTYGTCYVSDYALAGCHKISSLRLPSTLLGMGAFVLSDCKKLKDIYSYAIEPPVLTEESFMGLNLPSVRLHVYPEAMQKYMNAPYWQLILHGDEMCIRDRVWRDFGTIDEREFSSISDLSSTNGCIYRSGDQLILDGTVSGEEYRLYSLEGALLTQGTTLDGCTTVDVKTLPSSHYILVVSQSSYVITL